MPYTDELMAKSKLLTAIPPTITRLNSAFTLLSVVDLFGLPSQVRCDQEARTVFLVITCSVIHSEILVVVALSVNIASTIRELERFVYWMCFTIISLVLPPRR